MRYKILGKLPIAVVNFFKKEIMLRKSSDKPYQWIQFDDSLSNEFFKMFSNTELKIQYDPEHKRYVQKAFYSEPGYGYGPHRDGHQCMSALNIAISCNDSDFIRWYDSDLINELSRTIIPTDNFASGGGRSRNSNIVDYDDIPYTDELRPEIGQVYALDVDTFHSFKCGGPQPRIIVQTKFRHYPDLQTIAGSLTRSSFRNIIT
jgi:hypothetical protein